MIHFHTGCPFSKDWDNNLRNTLNNKNISFKENLFNIDKQSIFIQRIQEKCYKNINYFNITNKTWPEPLAYKLYNNKLLQYQLLQKHSFPIPKWIYIENKILNNISFPIVMKKTYGSSSKEVKLIFSTKEIETPCILQEYCLNNQGDYRIITVGNNIFCFFRHNKTNDFRASGSGLISVLNDLPYEPCKIAYDISKKFKFITMAYDFVINEGKWQILEMSYTYKYNSIQDYCKLYINNKNILKTNNINISEIIIDSILKKYNINKFL